MAFGSEEFFGRYDPSRSNDKILDQLNRFRERDLDQIRNSGNMQIAAEREKLAGFASIPERLAQGYSAGMSENRAQRQAGYAEEANRREGELHPFDIEARKQAGQMNTQNMRLAEEQGRRATDLHDYDVQGRKLTQDQANRQNAWLTKERKPGQTNEQYNYELGQRTQESGIDANRSSIAANAGNRALQQEQLLTAKEERAARKATGLYQVAMQAPDPDKAVAALENELKRDPSLTPGVLAQAKLTATSAVNSNIATKDILWRDSPPGQKTLADLNTLQRKSTTLAKVRTAIAQYKAAGAETVKADELKENIVSMLSQPEMGDEGQNAAKQFRSGLLGIRVDPKGLSSSSNRILNSLDTIQASIASDVQQLALQNQGVSAPTYQSTLRNTQAALQQAQNVSVNPPAQSIWNGKQLPRLSPEQLQQGGMQMTNGQQQPAPGVGAGSFRGIQKRGNP